MRTLTPAEARVIAVLLAARPDSERERIRTMDVPRSTYHAVRRRAYQEGWIRDRYVPHPVPMGRPCVSFLLARPYAEKFDDLARLISADEGAVVHWTGSQVSLSVMFHPEPNRAKRLAKRIEQDRLAVAPALVTVRAEGASVPVYFDFEGLWCHLAGLDGTLAYPHGLGGGMDGPAPNGDDRPTPALSSHQWWATGELLHRPFVAVEQGKGDHLVGPLGLPFSQRKLLERGWVVHRTFLDPGRIPAYQGRAADRVVFITGTPRGGAQPAELFATLGRECRVFPFLYAVAPDRWLIGALGGATPPAGEPPRRPVLATLREHLEGIEIAQESAGELTSRIDHRYDRLLPVAPTAGASRAG
jgi:hypothetical protein